MIRWTLMAAVLIVCVAGLPGDDASPKPGGREQPRVKALRPAGAETLQGKSLAITIKSDPTYGIYLESVQVVELGGSMFLVGTGVDSGVGEWTAGRRSWVAISDISEIVEFESAEELRESLTPEDDRPDA